MKLPKDLNSPQKEFFTQISSFILFYFILFYFFLILQLLYLFIYLSLAVLGPQFARGLSPATASGGHSSSRYGDGSSSRCAGLPPPRPLPLRGTGSRRAGSAAVAHGPSRSAACGILPDQGPNPRPPHQQADPQPPRHQGSPISSFRLSHPDIIVHFKNTASFYFHGSVMFCEVLVHVAWED